jgi:hypothetical protein
MGHDEPDRPARWRRSQVEGQTSEVFIRIHVGLWKDARDARGLSFLSCLQGAVHRKLGGLYAALSVVTRPPGGTGGTLHNPERNTEGEKCAIMILSTERGKSIAQAQDDRNRFFNLLAGCLRAIPAGHPGRAACHPGSRAPKIHLHRDAVGKTNLRPGDRLLR